ncbi:uncharacterized protein Z520_07953 [Fonsecaea multimorphosa CBS 102226]|uniref:Diaminohydroxyphosphoribosylamino-pyrimidine deaminase n=1 Tax=Fonsecaea multimorphosa CBS 102226 TaxID=1442371 RepID=A0A0D2H2T6_9EURO|nr:uncharacterized protein Z520_07953 [Fonsecaea multimorphosa CBS 102226]KIX96175.1 hypothetical protein Z520_07953 [Fonsecaea multimorphosa CBS 102226]OAL22245.1 hypothetical protein AYO22_07289 [Fonsecaea multimorphosa]
MTSQSLLAALGRPIEDAGEETFLLFSRDIPSNNLGFVDPKADSLEIEIAGHDYILQQSPGLLHSNRQEGTTGAVIWKITPLLAAWLMSLPPILSGVLHDTAVVVELGCGVTGLLGLVLSRLVQCYVLTDQPYVVKYLRENIAANSTSAKGKKNHRKRPNEKTVAQEECLKILPLDWEADSVANLKSAIPPGAVIDLLVLCDCVYNEYLISPLVQTCVDACRLTSSATKSTMVLVAQQLRSDTVCELFLAALMQEFNVWRIPDQELSSQLRSDSGYVVHLATLKDEVGKLE